MRIYGRKIDDLNAVFKALADETRLRILNLIMARESCVCEVMQALSISQTRASRNLTQLHEAGLIEQRRDGLWTIYYLSPKSTEYRDLIISAIDSALGSDKSALADRRKLLGSKRLCPPGDSQDRNCEPESITAK